MSSLVYMHFNIQLIEFINLIYQKGQDRRFDDLYPAAKGIFHKGNSQYTIRKSR